MGRRIMDQRSGIEKFKILPKTNILRFSIQHVLVIPNQQNGIPDFLNINAERLFLLA